MCRVDAPAFSISNELVQGYAVRLPVGRRCMVAHCRKAGVYQPEQLARACDFALRGHRASAARVTCGSAGRDVATDFHCRRTGRRTRRDMYLTPSPRIAHLPSYYVSDELRLRRDDGEHPPGLSLCDWLFDYEQPVYFPGVLFLLVILTGLAGVVRDWRRWAASSSCPGGLPRSASCRPRCCLSRCTGTRSRRSRWHAWPPGLSIVRLRGWTAAGARGPSRAATRRSCLRSVSR